MQFWQFNILICHSIHPYHISDGVRANAICRHPLHPQDECHMQRVPCHPLRLLCKSGSSRRHEILLRSQPQNSDHNSGEIRMGRACSANNIKSHVLSTIACVTGVQCSSPALVMGVVTSLPSKLRSITCPRLCLQDLLDHTFLHPERVMKAPSGGVSEEQLKNIVSQVRCRTRGAVCIWLLQ
jgi:hypothetical protein